MSEALSAGHADGDVPLSDRASTLQTRVFISYSRIDSKLAEWLWETLKARGFNAMLDQHDILPGEPWQERLSGLIQASDAVVFCVSPNFAGSQTCSWEVAEAARQGKRMLPVVIAETAVSSLPEQLRAINFIFIRNASEHPKGLDQLSGAINTDIGWVRDHTRFGELAQGWKAAGQSSDLLIRGSALHAMQKWEKGADDLKPPLTDEVKRFIRESEKGEARRARVQARTSAFLLILAVTSIAIGFAWFYQNQIKETLHWRLTMNPVTVPAGLAMQPGKDFADCENGCPRMIVIQSGSFQMSSIEARFPRERPLHTVKIGSPFAMARHEVTFDEWGHCVESGHCRGDISTNNWGRGTQPMINVTWNDPKQYVAWLSKVAKHRYRLPSEAEWEYSARAGSVDYFSFGNGDREIQKYAWYADNSEGHPHPVETTLASKFGLFDMHGNVAEWTEDCVNDSYDGNPPTDGSAWITGKCSARVFRGGSWLHSARMARSANRDWLLGDVSKDFIGFRVVRDID